MLCRQLDSADRQEPSEARTTKTTRLKERIAKLKEEMQRLHGLKARMVARQNYFARPSARLRCGKESAAA